MKFAVLTFIGAAALLMVATTTRAIPASVAQNMRRGKKPPPYDEPGIIHLFFFSFDLDYSTGDLDFGHQGVEFNVDTSRTDTWVLDENCNAACPEPPYFPEDSKTYKKTGDNFTLDYIDINGPLTLSGSLGTDEAYYGDGISGVKVKGVTFGIVNKTTREFPPVEYTGVLGLGRQAKSQNGAPSFLSLAAKQHAIKRESFGLRLDRLNTTTGLRIGMATLGGVEKEYTKGLQYHSLPPKSDAWELSLTDVLFNGDSLGYKRTALFDSTSWTIRVPEKDAEAIYKKIPGSKRLENGLYEIPRDSKVVITLQFDDQKYSMKASDMCYEYPDKGTTCNAAIQANDSKDVWTIGHPFLVNVYTVFDNVDKRIGFARADY